MICPFYEFMIDKVTSRPLEITRPEHIQLVLTESEGTFAITWRLLEVAL
jgi:hypothetical protein